MCAFAVSTLLLPICKVETHVTEMFKYSCTDFGHNRNSQYQIIN